MGHFAMPFYFTRALNAEFHSRDDGAHYARAQDAMAQAIGSAMAMASEEVDCRVGNAASSVEIVIEEADGKVALRSVVTVAHAALMSRPPPPESVGI